MFADADPRTHLLDPASVEAAIIVRTMAVIPVHLAGRPVDMNALQHWRKRHEIAVIEDCAQAHGAAYGGRPVGAIGDLAYARRRHRRH